MMIPATLEALQIFCSARYDSAELLSQEDAVKTVFNHPHCKFPLLFRFSEPKIYLQINVGLPGFFTPQTLPEVARLFHLLNAEACLPGFGIQEEHCSMYYRNMLPLIQSKIDPHILKNYLDEIEKHCDIATPLILKVAYGEITCDQAIKTSKQEKS